MKLKLWTCRVSRAFQEKVPTQKVVTEAELIFLDSKITVDCDYSHEIKRHLVLGRKALTNVDSVLKNRDVTLLTKVHITKAMVFPLVMCGCESWTINKAGYWRIDAFELWCWRRLLRVPWTSRRSNQSILKDWRLLRNINWRDWCWSWGSSNSATWCKEPTNWKRSWCWERLKAGVEGRGWDGWMASLTQWTWFWASSMR